MMRHVLVLMTFIGVLSGRAFAQPGVATPIAPTSDVFGNHITFTWQSSTGATWYQFWLGRADASVVLDHWYTAEAAGCGGGGVCTMTVAPAINAGPYNWYVRAWSAAGYGPWSSTYTFTMKEMTQAWSGTLPSSRRFTVVLNNAAVLDNETGLVWERVFSNGLNYGATGTTGGCGLTETGGRRGWRVPTLAELTSLIQPGRSAPAVPAGHPFMIPTGEHYYWSTTEYRGQAGSFFVVGISSGGIGVFSDMQTADLVCVRGGAGAK
jgi:hypothetical protein